MEILIGADPELFLKKGDNFFSAHGVIPGTKRRPHPVDKGAIQVDGMALEFNIDPAKSEEQFRHNINTVLSGLRDMVPSDLDFVLTPTAEFDPIYMSTLPKEALELGCDPDMNAYTGLFNDPPDGSSTMRTAAGHIHIGWTEGEDVHNGEHKERCKALVKQLDFYLGLPSLYYDRDTRRREMYGQAGAYRVKPYGVEYRVLSNYWLKSDALIEGVYYNAYNAADRFLNHKENLPEAYSGRDNALDIQSTINNSERQAAMYLCRELEIAV